MNRDFNVRHALIIALGLNRNCRTLIDEIYNKNDKEYYKIYRKSDFFNDIVKNIFTMETVHSMNKLIGIIEKSYQVKDYSIIEKLIKMVHPSIINFVKTSNVVDIDKFSQKYLQEKINILTELELFTILVCIFYLGKIRGKEIRGTGSLHLMFEYWNKLLQTAFLQGSNLLDELGYKSNKEGIGKSYSLFDLKPFEPVETDSLANFVENYIETKTINECKSMAALSRGEINALDLYKEVRSSQFKKGICKYIGSFSRVFDSFGIENLDASMDVKINNQILDLIFNEFELAKKYNNINESEKELYITSTLFMYNLIELYNQAKEVYLEKSKEEKYKDLEQFESILLLKEENLKSEHNKYIQKSNRDAAKIKELENELKKIRKENSQLVANNQKNKEICVTYENENKDLKQDRETLLVAVNQLEKLIHEEPKVSIEEMVEEINKYKIGVFGGMKSIEGLSKFLTNVTYYKNNTQDISSIKNLDYIFLNSDFFNHGFTNKIMSQNSGKNQTNFGYIGGTNIPLIITQIYNVIKK